MRRYQTHIIVYYMYNVHLYVVICSFGAGSEKLLGCTRLRTSKRAWRYSSTMATFKSRASTNMISSKMRPYAYFFPTVLIFLKKI